MTTDRVERLGKLAGMLRDFETEYRRERRDLITNVLGEELPECKDCKCPMLNRLLWKSIPQEFRKLFEPIKLYGSRGWCGNCYRRGMTNGSISYVRNVEKKTGKLSEAEIMHLRAKFQITPEGEE